jgi:hypothetical protein
MRLGAGGWILACCVVAMSGSAFAVSLSHSLKNYYAEYEIVLHCQTLSQLSADDAEAAKSAIAKIETYYLNKDSSIDKAPLLKAAIADKDEGFRILARSGPSGLRPYCRQSLHELLTKVEEIGPVASGQ